MYVLSHEAERLQLIDRLLQQKDHAFLERVTVDEVGRGLLDAQTLQAARALRLPATAIYLATLGIENLPAPGDRPVWLAAYQSLGRGQASEALARLPERLPLKWVVRQLLAATAPDTATLRKCKGQAGDWLAAAEFAVDHARFDLLEALIADGERRKQPLIDWLNLTKSLFVRHQLLGRQADPEPLGRCYERIRAMLPTHSLPLVNSRSRLALYASQCYLQAGKPAAAIAMADQAKAPQDTLLRLIDLAKAHCHAGQLQQALVWLDQLIAQVAVPEKLAEFKAERETRELDAEAPAKFDPIEASQALVALQQTLEPVGQKAFLVSGTLLGYAREGQLLAHDKDVDVGIIGWEDQFTVIHALLQSGAFAVDTRRIGGAQSYHIPIKHLATGVSIDIFIYHRENGKLVTGVQSYFGYLQKFAFTPFELKSVQFLGIPFHVPDDVERNLAENFGDWRVPDPGYISHLESPSTVDVGGEVYQVVGRLRALEAIKAGQVDKLTRVIDLMRVHRSHPGGMGEDTLQRLGWVRDTLAAETPHEVAEAC